MREYAARKRAEGVDLNEKYRAKVPGTCPSCGDDFMGREGQEFCSPECRNEVPGECAECGAPFVGPATKLYCSDRCAGRPSKAVRRERERAAFVAPVNRQEIFERDGWVCQICLERIDRRCRYPHPRSASIDHIIPLADGGTHEPANVQCAHLLCNSRKRDGAANDQLRLTG